MKQQIAIETAMENENNVVSEMEWQKWLAEYATLRSEAFLHILEQIKKKS